MRCSMSADVPMACESTCRVSVTHVVTSVCRVGEEGWRVVFHFEDANANRVPERVCCLSAGRAGVRDAMV